MPPAVDGVEEPFSDGQPDYDKWLAVHNLFMECIAARQKSLSRDGSDLESEKLNKILWYNVRRYIIISFFKVAPLIMVLYLG